jgi:hypothetical protein
MEQDKPLITNSESAEWEKSNNDLTLPCHSKKMPLWLVLLDNVPTLILFILGIVIINQISTIGAISFGAYALFSVVWFWAKICPYCHHYNTLACPCGYGAISPRMFKKRTDKSFKKVFKRNIGIVFPNWFLPLAVAIYLITTRYSQEIMILTISFSLIGFVFIPLISKLVACKNCDIRDDCPWMTINKNK